MTVLAHRSALARRRGASPLALLAAMLRQARERAALTRLDDAALDDIGVTRAEAEREAARAFWDVAPQRD